jgi:hypothetical protein
MAKLRSRACEYFGLPSRLYAIRLSRRSVLIISRPDAQNLSTVAHYAESWRGCVIAGACWSMVLNSTQVASLVATMMQPR